MIKTIIYTFMNRIATNITLHKCLFAVLDARCATLFITLSHKLSSLWLLACLGLSMLTQLLLPIKSFRRTLFHHFISKVVHDLFFSTWSFGKWTTSSSSSLRLFFVPNLLLRMRRNGHSCPSGINIVQSKFFVPGFVHNLFLAGFWTILATLRRMRRNGHKTTSGVNFDPKFDFSVPVFLYGKKFWKLDHDFMYF